MSASKLGQVCIGVKHPMAPRLGFCALCGCFRLGRRLPHEIRGSHWFPASPSHADCGETLDGALDLEMDRYMI